MLLQVPIDCAGIFPALHLRSADRQPGDSCGCECIRLMITGFRRLYAYIRWFHPRGLMSWVEGRGTKLWFVVSHYRVWGITAKRESERQVSRSPNGHLFCCRCTKMEFEETKCQTFVNSLPRPQAFENALLVRNLIHTLFTLCDALLNELEMRKRDRFNQTRQLGELASHSNR